MHYIYTVDISEESYDSQPDLQLEYLHQKFESYRGTKGKEVKNENTILMNPSISIQTNNATYCSNNKDNDNNFNSVKDNNNNSIMRDEITKENKKNDDNATIISDINNKQNEYDKFNLISNNNNSVNDEIINNENDHCNINTCNIATNNNNNIAITNNNKNTNINNTNDNNYKIVVSKSQNHRQSLSDYYNKITLYDL
jgi:hypothetical protein